MDRTGVRVVTRYAGSRLYEAAALAYVEAAQLRAWVAAGQTVLVRDARTGEDVTQAALLG